MARLHEINVIGVALSITNLRECMSAPGPVVKLPTSSVSVIIPSVLLVIGARCEVEMGNILQSPEAYSSERTNEREFLQELEVFLNQGIPSRAATRKVIEVIVDMAKRSADKHQRHLKTYVCHEPID
jgi:hypothetical protein